MKLAIDFDKPNTIGIRGYGNKIYEYLSWLSGFPDRGSALFGKAKDELANAIRYPQSTENAYQVNLVRNDDGWKLFVDSIPDDGVKDGL